MELTTKRETVYGGLSRRQAKQYFVYLRGERIGNGATKEEAQRGAKQTLADAYNYLTRACVVRVARDGSVLVFRQLSDTTAMYEFCRAEHGYQGHSCCVGQMTGNGGLTKFRTLGEYADYVIGGYDGINGTADGAGEGNEVAQ